MRALAFFKNIDYVVATIKAVKINNKDCKNDFCEAGLPSPPVRVITRWAIWIRTALYYSENLPAVRTIVNKWAGEGLFVSQANEAINVDGLVLDLVRVNQYRIPATNVNLSKASVCTITEAYELLKNMHFLDDPCSIQAYIKKRLSNSDLEAIIDCINLAIAPTIYSLLQKAQPTFVAIERSFSMLSKLLGKDRNFDIKNVKKCMLMYFNK